MAATDGERELSEGKQLELDRKKEARRMPNLEGTDKTAEFPSNWVTLLFVRKWRIGRARRRFSPKLRSTEMHDNYQRL